MMKNYLIKTKYKKEIFKEFVIGGLILLCSILPYIHDIVPKGIPSKISGYSSLRVFLYVVLVNLFGLIGWLIAYFEAKGKRYRFVIIVPIINVLYQLCIYILNLKKTSFNDINLKFLITLSACILIFLFYFLRKFKKNTEKI